MQELPNLGVRLVGEEHVGVSAEPDPEPAFVPALLQLPLALFVCELQRALLLEVQLEPEVGLAQALPDPLEVLAAGLLDLMGPRGRCWPGRCS